VGNTVFDPDVDAVTTATLQYDENGELLGNAQILNYSRRDDHHRRIVQNTIG
jgi:hypothetical protein